MGRSVGFLMVVIVMAVGGYIYMRQAQSVSPEGGTSPKAAVDLVGVKSDLMAIAQAERSHNALHGTYVPVSELQTSGELTMTRSNRGPYGYSVETSESAFRVVATYSGPDTTVPRTISVDQTMEFAQQ